MFSNHGQQSIRLFYLKEENHPYKLSTLTLTFGLGDVFRPQYIKKKPKQKAAVSVDGTYRKSSEILRWNKFVRQESKKKSCTEKKFLCQNVILSIPRLRQEYEWSG